MRRRAPGERMRKLFIVCAVFLATIVLSACAQRSNDVYSGTLQAPSAAVGSTVGGRVARVLVTEGSSVRKGAALVRFDEAQPHAALVSAVARLAQAEATRADLLAGSRPQDLARAQALAAQHAAQLRLAQATSPYTSRVARSQLRQALAQEYDARAAAKAARIDAARKRSLFSTGDVSAQQRDAAVAAEAHAIAQLAAAIAAVRSARAQAANTTAVTLPENVAAAASGYRAAQEQYLSLAAGPRPEQVRAAQAAVRSARGDVAAAHAHLADTTVRAPADGLVTAMDLHAGDLVAPGASVATIDENGNPYVRIYVPQSELGRIALGAKLSVRSDATPASFVGVVEQIDARAQFTPQSVQTADDRAVLSFGIKVRVHDPQQKLHPGTTVEVALP